MRTENVLDEFARANKSLAAARLLLSSSLFEDAVSRSYYAVMHASFANSSALIEFTTHRLFFKISSDAGS